MRIKFVDYIVLSAIMIVGDSAKNPSVRKTLDQYNEILKENKLQHRLSSYRTTTPMEQSIGRLFAAKIIQSTNPLEVDRERAIRLQKLWAKSYGEDIMKWPEELEA